MKMLKKIMIGMIVATSSAALYGNTSGIEEMTPKEEEITNSYNYWGIGAGIPTFLSAKFGHR